MTDATARPHLEKLVAGVTAIWPPHQHFISRHLSTFPAAGLDFLDQLAERTLKLSGDELDRACADYKWLCNFFLKYEIQFQRLKGPEHQNFADILARYYRNAEDMGKYMRGLMISQTLWRQHAGAAEFFHRRFLPALKPDYAYLEIGPGHGLWLSFAATDPRCASLTGFDVAPASLELTRAGLARLGVTRPVSLELQDICAAPSSTSRFDAIVLSQVLELVSSPQQAVEFLAASLNKGGLLMLNCPTRLTAPDHIRRWQSGAEIDALLTAAGLTVVATDKIAPAANQPVEAQGYSYLVIAQKP